MNKAFQGKTAVITGAGSGIGKALAEKLAEMGANVVLAARSEQVIEDLARTLDSGAGNTLAVRCDVSDESDCRRLIEETVKRFGGIDLLINNAGISMRELFAHTDPQVLKRLMDVNFWGTVYCTRFALPYLLQAKGTVVGVSSIAGYKGLPARTGYSASKFAMQGFLESLRIENLKTGLHVLIACPGFTASNIRNTALKGDGRVQGESPRDEASMMQPEEVAEHILQAALQRKNTLVLTTQGKLTVFLNKWFPRFMDKMVYNHMAKEPDSPFK
jgi:dehydrogenase/reductase SDR family protein 7B